MAFPFLPVGALVASLVLFAALTMFALAMRAIDRTVARVGGAVVSSLVTGWHDWAGSGPADPTTPTPPATADPDEPAPAVEVELVRRA